MELHRLVFINKKEQKKVKGVRNRSTASHTEKFRNMIHRVAKDFGIIMAGQDGMIE